MLALILSNSSWQQAYQQFLHVPLLVHQPLLFWINDGLMTLFFLQIGLELKHDMRGGLHDYWRHLLPLVAACGGMVCPVLIYIAINWHAGQALAGWAIPVATDIAFASGVLALFGRRVPPALKMFLLALAIFDDIGAILIIAFCQPQTIVWQPLAVALAISGGLLALNYYAVKNQWLYLLLGFCLWCSVLHAGIHATLAGVVLGLLIPQPEPGGRLQRGLTPWVTWIILPLFAAANAGVSLRQVSLPQLTDGVTLGIVAGLCLGKPLGVMLSVGLSRLCSRARLPQDTTWLALFGVALVCGIGFTMSLFLGTLAFQENNLRYLTEVKLGVLIGSLTSGILGALILRIALKNGNREERPA